MQAAAEFYGVDLKVISADGARDGDRAIAVAVKQKETVVSN